MKTKLEQICDEVAKENGFSTFKGRGIYSQSDLWPEVCKRYAIEVAKASLEKASKRGEYCYIEQFDDSRYVIDIDDITDEQNIVL